MAKYDVKVGSDFEVSAVEVDTVDDVLALSNVSVDQRSRKMRDVLALATVVVLGLSLGVAVLIGFQDGSFNEVNAVWTAGAVPLGFVLRSYFDKG